MTKKATCGYCSFCAKGWRDSKRRYHVYSNEDAALSVKREVKS